jgi:hypothetical protein
VAEITPPLFMDVDLVYSGDELGLPLRDILGEGVLGLTHLKVSQRAAGGANMSVDIAAGATYMMGDEATDRQPNYRGRSNSIVNLGVSAAHATLPRIDRVVAECLDATFSGVSRLWRTRVIAGTATAAADLENLNGAAAVPNNAHLLANVLVPAASTSVIDANIRDTRKRAIVGGAVAFGGLGALSGWTPIEDRTLTVAAGTITFSSIPQDFEHLALLISGRSDAAVTGTNVSLRVNGDSGANYDSQQLVAGGTVVTATEQLAAAQAVIGQLTGASSPASNVGQIQSILQNYTGAFRKTFRSDCANKQTDATLGTIVEIAAGAWRSGGAITSLSAIIASGNFIIGSRATLYGLGAA